MEYRARKSAHFSNEKAQIYGVCIEEIMSSQEGKVQPKDVVHVAEGIDSPLHECFEWNNEVAGANYRLVQARHLMGNIVRVTIQTEDNKETEQRAFLNVELPDKEQSTHVYISIQEALTNEEYRQQILKKAMSEITYWQQKYKEYHELSDIFKAIEATKPLFN